MRNYKKRVRIIKLCLISIILFFTFAVNNPPKLNAFNLPSIITSRPSFSWPTLKKPPKILREFDHETIDYLPGHRGVDLSAHVGEIVFAPASGVITLNKWVFTRNVVLILHSGGYLSTLESVKGFFSEGTPVIKGEPIGIITPEQIHTPNSLYWGVRYAGFYVNPVALIDDYAVIRE
jgi:murein DD-endopeptidase MepM/ murein hydrolase activator NlpD